MRVLVVGAGATGGYFGARLVEAGKDVTFLVRPARAEALAASGLRVKSPVGDVHIAEPATLTAADLAAGKGGGFDIVLLSCKAYDLDAAIADVAPAVGPTTLVLPVLNGLRHLDILDAAFGPERVLGGSCAIAATVTADGEIRMMSPLHSLTYGERAGGRSERVERIEALMQGVAFQARLSEAMVLEMWEKWTFLATLAGATWPDAGDGRRHRRRAGRSRLHRGADGGMSWDRRGCRLCATGQGDAEHAGDADRAGVGLHRLDAA